jgi:phosphocarrier protein HPr
MITKTIEIINKLGLHARASSKLVMLAGKFNSDITITKDNKLANCKSLMSVMMLAANRGSSILLSANGNDEEVAINELEELINSKFGEAE